MCTGAGSAPARNTIARSRASLMSKLPVIEARPPLMRSRITGAEYTVLSRMMARRRPTLRAGEVVELLGAAGVELEGDVRPFELGRRPHQRVGDDVAGHQGLRFHQVLRRRPAPGRRCGRRPLRSGSRSPGGNGFFPEM